MGNCCSDLIGKCCPDSESTSPDDIHTCEVASIKSVSTHLWYRFNQGSSIVGYRATLCVDPGYDPIESFYAACCFTGGYLGMQVISATERRILFSVWDKSQKKKCEVIEEGGDDITVKRFDGEGEGYQSYFKYDWKTGEDHHFMVTADVEGMDSVFSGYYLLDGKWKLLSRLKRPGEARGLRGLYSFLENFGDCNDHQKRCHYGGQFIYHEGGPNWEEMCKCGCTNTGPDPPDPSQCFGYAVDGNTFVMWTDGEEGGRSIPENSEMNRSSSEFIPDPLNLGQMRND